MWQIREEYEFGIVVGHNMNPVRSGAGSCIFLHIWGGSLDPTSGCTAMSRENLLDIIYWLDSEKFPLLIQLTKNAYYKLKDKWSLPNFK
jgi:L,D-peptidoglycan transpeptidase YkuD (ErfK/YbiS/YcfS/YnhG family)